MSFRIRDEVQFEHLDDRVLILLPDRADVLHLVGAQAEAFDCARRGVRDVPDRLITAMAGLVEADVISTDRWSRRQVLHFGGIAAAAAITVTALPSVAAASSPSEPEATAPASTTTLAPPPPKALWIASQADDLIARWDPATATLTTPFSGSQNRVPQPYGMATDDAGNLCVPGGARVYVLDVAASTRSTLTSREFGHPQTVACDAAGNVWVGDTLNHQVLVVRADDRSVEPGVPERVSAPTGLAFDAAGDLWISSVAGRVHKYEVATSRLTTEITSGIRNPRGLAFDPHGNLWIANYGDHTLVVQTPGGGQTTIGGSGRPMFNAPRALAFDPSGRKLWVSSWGNDTVVELDIATNDFSVPIVGFAEPSGLAFA